ncbi:GNAT family N-acetyltransferase [Candidatus Gracilibacteria bacterium]|nr:GNAT family N-acetyltransferase [Candidatus Gracilibacteria bacterium]NJM86289.1 GNAT family N-acetyltransferase [Hydrococcus sp. RU_2_2]NJP18103.1 GNAT family N-acetyltransferase [Hydrococcus sp. CRU_1_1]
MLEIQFSSYFPGVVGKIAEAHATYYYLHWGLDKSFETEVATELAEFISEFEPERDGLWIALWKNKFVGSIAIDGRTANIEGARLRWFIVSPEFQGLGAGKTLISQAVNFCQSKHYSRVYLWTFQGLSTARLLYERFGFFVSQENFADFGGQKLRLQKLELILGSNL